MAISKALRPGILLIALFGALAFSIPDAVTLNLGNVALTRVVLQQDVSAAASAKQWLEFGMPSVARFRSLTRLYLAQGQTTEAIEAGKQAVALTPSNPLAAYWLGQANWAAGDKDTARRVWRASGAIEGKLTYLGRLCWQYAGLGDPDAAEAVLREALDLDPEWGPAYDALASLDWGRNWQTVSWALNRATTYLPEGTAMWYWNVGRRYLMNGDWPAAAHALRAAADLEPAEWTLRFLVDALQRSGDSTGAAKAQADLEKFLHKQ
jgi:tetratricopeptide (TPR) repeat protein